MRWTEMNSPLLSASLAFGSFGVGFFSLTLPALSFLGSRFNTSVGSMRLVCELEAMEPAHCTCQLRFIGGSQGQNIVSYLFDSDRLMP